MDWKFENNEYTTQYKNYLLVVFPIRDVWSYRVYFQGFVEALGHCKTLEEAKEFAVLMAV